MSVNTYVILYYIFYVSDLNLILIRLNKSKESTLQAAEHCYLRALELGTNVEKKNTLNKQIGFVYSEYISFYTSEIVSKFKCNLKSINNFFF